MVMMTIKVVSILIILVKFILGEMFAFIVALNSAESLYYLVCYIVLVDNI